MTDDQDRATVSVFVDDAVNDGTPTLSTADAPLAEMIWLFRAECEQHGRLAAEEWTRDAYELTDDEVTVVGALADMVDRMIGEA